MKIEDIRGKIPALTMVVCSLWIVVFSFTLDAVANEATMYDLTVTVVSGHGTVEPNSCSYSAGTVVTLTATPEPDYNMRQWTGTDDDTSCSLTNTVTMDSDKTVTVEFGLPHIILVLGEYTTIQGAIDAAVCGDVVVLIAGVYHENINFNGKNITVTSTHPDDPACVASTIIKGTGTGPVVTFSGSESQNCKLDGVTITDGNTMGDGGGICGNGTEATIANCVITNNHADGAGGGVSNCKGTISGCTITGNTASGNGGGIYVFDCNVTIEDCDINNNAAADGGGLYFLDSWQAKIFRCSISDNDANGSGMARGGGIYALNSPIWIKDCRISRNYATYGGGGVYLSYYLVPFPDGPYVTQCLITENTAGEEGGGISCEWEVVPRIYNCTIADNSVTDGYGGGLCCSSFRRNGEVINSIIWGNFAQQGSQVALRSGATSPASMLRISYSDVEGGPGGVYVYVGGMLIWSTGAIDSDPQLVDPNGGDLHLSAGSPCIDAGYNKAALPTDLDGNPRIVNGTVDMGAYEFQGLFKRYYHVDGINGDNTNDGLTRETAFETIQFAIDEADDGDTILVWPGVYNETATHGINFKGKAVTVKSAADAAVLEVPGFVAVSFVQGEDRNSIFSNFVVRGCTTAIFALFANPTISNVTVVGNDNGIIADNAKPLITNCIFWNNTNGDLFGSPDPITAQYSFTQDEAEANLVAYWKFDEGSGTIAYDSAGTNDGTIYGSNWVTGQVRGALSFDGVDDYVDVGNDSSLMTTGDLTIIAWIKARESRACIYSHTWNGWRLGFGIGNDNYDGRLGFYTWNHGKWIEAGSSLADDTWHHVAVTLSGTIVTLYTGGIKIGSDTGTPASDLTGIGLIGLYNYDWHFGGLIDDVRIYNHALSAAEIEALYKAGLAGLSYVEPGFVDANSGDYHLLSERGRYRATTDEWILDDVTGPCIDGGDPSVDPSNERMPNGGRINMGAYGNTAYASMSECWSKADFNCDGIVNFSDLAIFALDWLGSKAAP
jgi:parallel beta-helix repeat protein